jgi:hypothetical protein
VRRMLYRRPLWPGCSPSLAARPLPATNQAACSAPAARCCCFFRYECGPFFVSADQPLIRS